MSELRADTITASNGTSPVTLTKQSAAKAWFSYYQDVDTIGDSFNIASMTDQATGHWYGNFTNNMVNKNFAQPAMTHGFRTRYENNDPANNSTTARTITCAAYNSSGNASDAFSTLTVNGDLA